VRSEGFYVNEKFLLHQLGSNQRSEDMVREVFEGSLRPFAGETESGIETVCNEY